MEPKVSVVVPVLNVVQYIRKCMDSILHQTMQEIEVLVVDADSTDGTHEILEEYARKDSRVRLLADSKRSTGFAKNLGIDLAKAPYIAIVESDDWIEQDMFEKMYAAAEEHQVDFVKANFSSFVEEPNKTYEFPKTVSYYSDDYGRVVDARKDNHCFRWIMFEWLGLYRKAFLERCHIRHNESPGAAFQDTGFWFLTMAHASRIYLMKESFYHYRCDNMNASVKNPNKVFDICREYEYIRDELEKDEETWKRVKPAYYRGVFYDNMVVYRRIRDEYRESLMDRICIVMREGLQEGMLDSKLYLEAEWKDLEQILESPQKFAIRCKADEKEREKGFKNFLVKIRDYANVFIVGAGSYGCNLQYRLEKNGIRIRAFADNDRNKWGSTRNGIEIVSPMECEEKFSSNFYFIANQFHGLEIKRGLQGIGIEEERIHICDFEKSIKSLI